MSLILRNAKIIQPKTALNNVRKDILIKNGLIKKIADKIKDKKAKSIESKNLHVSIGWMDIGSFSGEPGYEHREDLNSLTRSAAAGGYTALAPFPNSLPVCDNKSAIQFILNTTAEHAVDYYPVAAISKGCKGKEITEMIDMFRNGAVAFSDGYNTITTSGLMLRALEYAKSIDAPIIHHPVDEKIANGNDIHEGLVSTALGLKASPALAELITLERDIKLCQYSGSKLLVHNISSLESIQSLERNRTENMSCSVSFMNLCATDEAINNFDVNFKLRPPLRAEADRKSLVEAVSKGTIEIITSNHFPLEEEAKKKEFVFAEAGATGLQTCFSSLMSYAPELPLSTLIKCLAYNPRKLLNIDIPVIGEGEKANLCLFDPSMNFVLDAKTNLSKSKNAAFWEKELKGKVLGIINGNKTLLNN